MKLPEFINMEFFVAGLKFGEYEFAKDSLAEGTSVTLEPEPDNPFDPTAVAICYDGWKLGFIPAKTGEAKMIFKAIEEGREFEATVTRNKPETVEYRRLKIRITQKEVDNTNG